MRVGLAENLGHGACRPVAGQKDASQKAGAPARPLLARQPQQDGEQDRPFTQGFVDLARVAGIGAAAWKDHRPGHVGDAPEQLTGAVARFEFFPGEPIWTMAFAAVTLLVAAAASLRIRTN